jgi:manganese-dependent inorganic pyrophosphatase
MINVFGHTNPDSDAVCSAVVAAFWLSSQGRRARAWRLGEVSRETRYIVRVAGLHLPERLIMLREDEPVWLVDFTEPAQGPGFLSLCNIIGIIDHHRLGGLITHLPPEVWIKPVGSSATLLWTIMEPPIRAMLPPAYAILLLGAIISDTIALKSPTTTDDDYRAVAEISKLAGVNLSSFTAQLLAAKTDTDGLNAEELLEKDLKAFVISGTDVRIAQLEVSSPEQVQNQLGHLKEAMSHLAEQTGAGLVVLMVTDIVKSFSTLYFAGPALKQAGPCSVPGMLSRKKQLLPWLASHLKINTGEAL